MSIDVRLSQAPAKSLTLAGSCLQGIQLPQIALNVPLIASPLERKRDHPKGQQYDRSHRLQSGFRFEAVCPPADFLGRSPCG